MKKIIWKELKEDDPIFKQGFIISTHNRRQIDLVKPKIIIAVGRIAAQSLLGSDLPMGKLRGRIHGFGSSQIPTLVIYHPAYLLRSPSQKHKVWEDLQIANDFLKK